MAGFYLAIDITKESGRHILGWLDKGRLKLEEVYSFTVSHTEKDGKKLWDLQELFRHIKEGIAYCMEIGRLPVLVGLTASDGYFVLLDNDDRVIDDMVFSLHDALAGNPDENYSSCALRAKCFLMLSDYFNFMLTGRKQCEYTGLLGGRLLSMETGNLNEEYVKKLGLDREHFPLVSRPGNVISNLTLEVTEAVGYDFVIIQAPSQKTCAAIAKISDIYRDSCEEEDMAKEGREENGRAETDKSKGSNGKDENREDSSEKDNMQNKAADARQDEKNQQAGIAEEMKAAIGCLCILMITSHEFSNFDAARECIRKTFSK